MLKIIPKTVTFLWNFVFNHKVSPLRHIPDVAVRHYILQILGVMWAICFSIAVGSYTVFALSVLGHVVLIAAVAITVSTWTVATVKPDLFPNGGSPDQ